jgi:putative transposase
VKAGVFLALWQAGIEQFAELCGIDWDWLAMDGAMSKAPLGGEKTGPNPTDRGKSGVKRSVLTEGHGVPLAGVVEGANRHDMKLTRPTLAEIVVERPAPTEAKPQGMCLDKGYDYDEVRDILHEFGFTAHIRAWGRSQGSQEGGRVQSASVGSRTNALVDSAVSPAAYQMGQKAGELSRLSPFRLWLDCFSGCRVIRIGT